MQIKGGIKIKKILIIIIIKIIFFEILISLISCTKNDNWNNIQTNPPSLPVEVIGFSGINFKTIDSQNNKQTIPKLLKQLEKLFKGTKWNFKQLKKEYKFNNKKIKQIEKIDFYRNGDYELNFNDGTTLNVIKIIKTLKNFNHLADKITNINLGLITDTRPKTILIAIIFNNMHLISEIDKFGEFFIGSQTSNIWNRQIYKVDKIIINNNKNEAILNSEKEYWTEYDNPKINYYGSVKVHFSVINSETPPLKKENLKQIKLITNLGKLSKITILQIMMLFISINFVNKLNYLSILLNDLYLYIKPNKKTGTIVAYNKSKYYTGSINIFFN